MFLSSSYLCFSGGSTIFCCFCYSVTCWWFLLPTLSIPVYQEESHLWGWISYVGKLVGRFYDEDGNPTKELNRVAKKIAQANKLAEQQKADEDRFPNCNSRWSQDKGGEVWLEPIDSSNSHEPFVCFNRTPLPRSSQSWFPKFLSWPSITYFFQLHPESTRVKAVMASPKFCSPTVGPFYVIACSYNFFGCDSCSGVVQLRSLSPYSGESCRIAKKRTSRNTMCMLWGRWTQAAWTAGIRKLWLLLQQVQHVLNEQPMSYMFHSLGTAAVDLDGTTFGIDIVVRKKLALYGPYGTKLWLLTCGEPKQTMR